METLIEEVKTSSQWVWKTMNLKLDKKIDWQIFGTFGLSTRISAKKSGIVQSKSHSKLQNHRWIPWWKEFKKWDLRTMSSIIAIILYQLHFLHTLDFCGGFWFQFKTKHSSFKKLSPSGSVQTFRWRPWWNYGACGAEKIGVWKTRHVATSSTFQLFWCPIVPLQKKNHQFLNYKVYFKKK